VRHVRSPKLNILAPAYGEAGPANRNASDSLNDLKSGKPFSRETVQWPRRELT